MLVIRRAQMDAFAEVVRADFERRAVAHLQRALPERCANMGPAAVLASVRDAIERAGAHGITSELAVLAFLNVMYVAGFDFDTDPRFPWAIELLRTKDLPDRTRMRLVSERAQRELFS